MTERYLEYLKKLARSGDLQAIKQLEREGEFITPETEESGFENESMIEPFAIGSLRETLKSRKPQ
jgi:hypothetical protein